jgi:hypothetical protein
MPIVTPGAGQSRVGISRVSFELSLYSHGLFSGVPGLPLPASVRFGPQLATDGDRRLL